MQIYPSSTYNTFNNKGIKYITRLQLGLSYLREHKFKHSIAPILQIKDLSS